MPSKTAAVVEPEVEALGTFEGLPVLGVGIEIPNAAGGLRDPLKIDPLILHGGEEAFATFQLATVKIRFDPVNGDDDALRGWTRVHVLAVTNATFIDEELVRDQLDEMAERVEERRQAEALEKERAKGIRRLDFSGPIGEAHAAGEHTELVEGCGECDAEQRAVAAEAVDGKTAAAGG
jgi:hypothetical protein